MSINNVKYTKNGRMPKALKIRSNEVKAELLKWGDNSRYEFSSMEELEAVRDMARKKFVRTQDISSEIINKEPKVEPEEILTEQKQPEQMSEVAEPVVTQEQPPQNYDFNFGEDFTGMDQTVISRSYNHVPTNEYTGQDIPEPQVSSSIDAMLRRERGEDEASESAEAGGGSESTKETVVGNPALNELGDKEKTLAAEQFADGILSAYEGAHAIAGNFVKMKEEKLVQKINDGEIDGEVKFPVDASGNELNILEYAEVYNGSVDRAMTYDPEFNAKVKPPMVRLLKKNNIGLSDGQTIAVAFAQDAGMKVIQLVQLGQGQKMIIKSLQDWTRKKNEESSEAVNVSSIERPIKKED